MDEQHSGHETQQPEDVSPKEQIDSLKKSMKSLRKGLGLSGLFCLKSRSGFPLRQRRRPSMSRRDVRFLISSRGKKAGKNKSGALDKFLSQKEQRDGRHSENR